MNTHRATAAYSQAFKTFLEHTDEKAVLASVLHQRLRRLGTKSLLDIGAGNGELAVQLFRMVDRYLAVEQKSDYIARLKSLGISIIEESFPCQIGSQFDTVLISHALPSHSDGRDGWEPFVKAAWERVNPTGHLLVVTFEDEDSEWNDLVEQSGLEKMRPREKRLEPLEDYLVTFGHVDKLIVTTHVTTSTVEQMLEALAFVWSDGEPNRTAAFLANKKILTLLDRCWDGVEYQFPFHHYLIDVQH